MYMFLCCMEILSFFQSKSVFKFQSQLLHTLLGMFCVRNKYMQVEGGEEKRRYNLFITHLK